VAVYYPEFGDFCDVAADILGITSEHIARFHNVVLAESALAAPRAGFGDVEVYPTILEKAAILLERLAPNHPLPDGNKRTAFFLTRLFLEANGAPLRGAQPDIERN
jgi:death on curing protein